MNSSFWLYREDSDEDRRLHVLDLAKGMVFFVVHNIGHKHETENETAIPGKIYIVNKYMTSRTVKRNV